MSNDAIEFMIHENSNSSLRSVPIKRLVIAGWTGRDPISRDKHIAELKDLGVPPPASTPIFYSVASSRLSTRDILEASGDASSGEVEFVLLRLDGRMYVGVGSDHTDRNVETYNITVSKQMCEKPIAPELWAFEDVSDHWDELILRSYATIDGRRELYQEGALAGMLPPKELIELGFGDSGIPEGLAMFGGTFAARGGIRPASKFEYEIVDPVLKRQIEHGYTVESLPNRG